MVFHLLVLLNPCLDVECSQLKSFFCKCYFGRSLSELPELISLLILVGGPLVIRIGCMIFLLLFLDSIRIPTPTVSFLAEIDPQILCM